MDFGKLSCVDHVRFDLPADDPRTAQVLHRAQRPSLPQRRVSSSFGKVLRNLKKIWGSVSSSSILTLGIKTGEPYGCSYVKFQISRSSLLNSGIPVGLINEPYGPNPMIFCKTWACLWSSRTWQVAEMSFTPPSPLGRC